MSDNKKFGLCLSGGGFRATLYHLGVIKFLHDANLLEKVTHIFSVSGGSILAAHMVLNWDKYTGSKEDFEEMAKEIIQFSQSDVRGKVIRKWILSWLLLFPRPLCWLFRKFKFLEKSKYFRKGSWRITTYLEDTYSDFYNNKTLGDINKQKLPQLYLLSASLTTGKLFSFNNEGIILVSDKEGENPYQEIPIGEIPISKAVAASSAFPPVFSPVAITQEMLKVKVTDFAHTEYLSDGGVYDNLGIRKLFLLQRLKEFEFDNIFLSDAGSAFSWKPNKPYNFILSLSVRASEMLMMRVGNLEHLELDEIKLGKATKVATCKIDKDINEKDEKHPLSEETQRSLWEIRTDLNAFSNWEINVLTQHGYATARKSCGDFVLDEAETNEQPVQKQKIQNWIPEATKKHWKKFDLDEEMKKASRRNWNLFSFRDVNTYLSLCLLLIILLIPFGIFSDWAVYSITVPNLKEGKAKYENRLTKNTQHASNILNVLDSDDPTIDESEKINEVKKLIKNIQEENLETIKEVDSNNEKIFKKKAAVKIKAFDKLKTLTKVASGFFVSENGYVLTVQYAVDGEINGNQLSYKIELEDGSEKDVELIKVGKNLALLKVKEVGENTFKYFNFNKDEISVSTDTPVVVIGYFRGENLNSKIGKVLDVTNSEQFLQIKFSEDKEIASNDSRSDFSGLGGGAVISANGDIVGVLYSSNLQTSVVNCILAKEARKFLNEHLPKLDQ